MNKVTVIIEKGNDNYSAYISELKNHAINGSGKTVIDAINDFHIALKEMREMYIEDGEREPLELVDLLFEYVYDD